MTVISIQAALTPPLTDTIPKRIMLDIINQVFQIAEEKQLSREETERLLKQAVIQYEPPDNVVNLDDFRNRRKKG